MFASIIRRMNNRTEVAVCFVETFLNLIQAEGSETPPKGERGREAEIQMFLYLITWSSLKRYKHA